MTRGAVAVVIGFAIGLAVVAACSSFSSEPESADAGVEASDDAGNPIGTGPCDATKSFAPASIFLHDLPESFEAIFYGDQVFYVVNEDGGPGFHLANVTIHADGSHSALHPVNVRTDKPGQSARSPSLSADGKTIYYLGRTPVDGGNVDQLFRATRNSTSELDFTGAKISNLDLLSAYYTGASIWYARRTGGSDGSAALYRSDAPVDGGMMEGGSARADINGVSGNEQFLVALPDEKRVYFASTREGTTSKGGYDVWTASRNEQTGMYEDAEPVPELSTNRDEFPSWVSQDGCKILVTRVGEDGLRDVYISQKPPAR